MSTQENVATDRDDIDVTDDVQDDVKDDVEVVDDGKSGERVTLLDDTSGLSERWQEIQTRFVDEPRRAVEDADGLVADVLRQLTDTFSRERDRLEHEWNAGEDVSTEDLRVALQRYRSFFERLLAA
jgi:hypothetical protein